MAYQAVEVLAYHIDLKPRPRRLRLHNRLCVEGWGIKRCFPATLRFLSVRLHDSGVVSRRAAFLQLPRFLVVSITTRPSLPLPLRKKISRSVAELLLNWYFFTLQRLIMKNLLLLFLVSFALFWVGCEKEEVMPIDHSSDQALEVLRPSSGHLKESTHAEKNQFKERPDCGIIQFHRTDYDVQLLEQGVRVSFSYSPVIDWNSTDGFVPVLRQVIFINGTALPTTEYQQNIFTIDCLQLEEGELLTNSVIIDWRFFGENCPDQVQGNISVGLFNPSTNTFGPPPAGPNNFKTLTADIYARYNEFQGFIYCEDQVDGGIGNPCDNPGEPC